MEFKISGRPYVKKSNMKLVMRGRKLVRIPTANYTSWATKAREQIEEQMTVAQPIDYPINLQCLFFMNTAGVVDLSALYEGIQDELVKCGVLSDDNYKIVASHDGSGVFVDRDDPRMEITITRKGGDHGTETPEL